MAKGGGPSLLLCLPESEGKREGDLEGWGQLYQARFWFWNQNKRGKVVVLSLQLQLEGSGLVVL